MENENIFPLFCHYCPCSLRVDSSNLKRRFHTDMHRIAIGSIRGWASGETHRVVLRELRVLLQRTSELTLRTTPFVWWSYLAEDQIIYLSHINW